MKNWRRFCLLLASILTVGTLLTPQRGVAHPMGNFSINHFSALEIHPSRLRVVYVLDFAEIPTFQEMQEHKLTARSDDPRVVAYRERRVQELRQGLILQIGEQRLPLSVHSSVLTFPPGLGGLPTMRIEAIYEASLEILTGQVIYEDHNYAERVGWKEIVAAGYNGVRISVASVPTESKSNRLTSYADELLQAPPQDLRATLSFVMPSTAQGRVAVPSPVGGTRMSTDEEAQPPSNLLTELVTSQRLSIGVVAFSLLVAFGLGAFHALEPGHGKTLVAAYLIGSRGTAWHALVLGLTVTASHTIGVYALGAIALFAAHYVLPEQLYPWLGLTSGLLIATTGVILLAQAWHRFYGYSPPHHLHAHNHAHNHFHEHDHDHSHSHDYSHTYPHDRLRYKDSQTLTSVGYGALLTLGITGGMIPCPAALVVLLSAVALQRIAFGLLLIVAFSLGLAAVLVGTGFLLVSARGVLQRWGGKGSWQIYLPFVSPMVITPLGFIIAFRSLSDFGIGLSLPF